MYCAEDNAMSTEREKQQLALQGGLKAVTQVEGKGEPKIGLDEFMSIAERFGFSQGGLKKMRALLEKEDLGAGAYLANYYSGLKESKVQAYERVAKRVFGVKHAIGVSSGTAALHSAFVAVGVGPGKEVICPAIGFVATAVAVVAANGIPVFCDVDESLSMDPARIEKLITKRTVAIAPTAIMGSVCNMKAIMKVARKHKLKVVEDCAQSSGASFAGRMIGTIGDIGCFSISAYKIVGGGEGGLLITNSKRLWERASQFVEAGGLWRPDRFAAPRYNGELFCGTNYRMSEVEAAIDVVQLDRMKHTVRRSRAVKKRITSRLKTYREITPQILNDADGEVGYLLRFFPKTISLGKKIVEALNAEGVSASTRGGSTTPDWHLAKYMYPVILKNGPTDANCPYECPIYKKAGGKVSYKQNDCPVANDLYGRLIGVPLNQWYSAADCTNIVRAVNKVLSAYCTEDPSAAGWR